MIVNIELLVAIRSCVHDPRQRMRTSLARLGKQVDDIVDLFAAGAMVTVRSAP